MRRRDLLKFLAGAPILAALPKLGAAAPAIQPDLEQPGLRSRAIPLSQNGLLDVVNHGFAHQRRLMREARFPVIYAASAIAVPRYFQGPIIPEKDTVTAKDREGEDGTWMPWFDTAQGGWREWPVWVIDGKRYMDGGLYPINEPGLFRRYHPLTGENKGRFGYHWSPRLRFNEARRPTFNKKDGMFHETIAALMDVHWEDPGREERRIYCTSIHLAWRHDMDGVIVKMGDTTRSSFPSPRGFQPNFIVMNAHTWAKFQDFS